MTGKPPLHVCYFGTYRENYSRNQMMIAGLRLNGITVSECHQTLWHGIDDRVRVVSGKWMYPSFWLRVLNVYWKLLQTYFRMKDFDVLVVGYPGQFDVFPARILSWLKRKRLVWDVFMSIYLISLERELEKHNQLSMKLLHLLESIALKLPNLLILDTSEYVNWFTMNYKINSNRFRLVPTGADERIFFPIKTKSSTEKTFRVLYAGTFIPNHGVLHIVEAAKCLKRESDILFELIGSGPDLIKAQQYVLNNQLSNVKFLDWMEKGQLTQHISQADVCLGAFGTTPQSMMTVQNKVYETIAMAKPLISGDSPAIRQVFTHGKNIYLCERANGRSLAKAIITLLNNPSLRNKLGTNAFLLYKTRYDLLHNGQRFYSYLLEVI